MVIPYAELSDHALRALIENFVTRDGSDYGQEEMAMTEKAARLLELLKSGNLLINYGPDTLPIA
jgi:uncharacterized protein YheU (UPF0270 family)